MLRDTQGSIEQRCMRFTGEGKVSVEPDIAIIRLGVETRGENLQSVQDENRMIASTILDSVRNNQVTDIKTFQFNIERQYEYRDGERVDLGYVVRNIFEIRTNQLEQVGAIIDEAVGAGANVVDFIGFDVSDPEYYYLEALNMAVDQSIQKAKSVARNLGLLGEPTPICIAENSTIARPLQDFALREFVANTPIEPGTKDITANVTVEFSLPFNGQRRGY